MIQFLVIINPRTNITPNIAPIVAELSFLLEKIDSNTAVNATTLIPADAAPSKGFTELYLVMNSMITINKIRAKNSAMELLTLLSKKKQITAIDIRDQP